MLDLPEAKTPLHFCRQCGVDQENEHRPWCRWSGVFRYYLSPQDLEDRLIEVDDHFGDDVGCGGTWTFSGPPCGGCIDCARAMTSHYFYGEVTTARIFQKVGFEYASPVVIDYAEIMRAGGVGGGFEKHDSWNCKTAGEDERWPRPSSASSSSSTGSGEASTA